MTRSGSIASDHRPMQGKIPPEGERIPALVERTVEKIERHAKESLKPFNPFGSVHFD